MQLAKILGRTTYQKSMQELREFRHIDYSASFNRFKKTLVELKKGNSEKEVSTVGAQLTSDRNCEGG
jgi:hypothetical protein